MMSIIDLLVILLSFGLVVTIIYLFIRIINGKSKEEVNYYEKLVAWELNHLPKEYTVFNNVLFQSNSYSTQIDHIVVSRYGVFVIETKGHKGIIIGDETSKKWKQVIYKNRYDFYNPIQQNMGHIKWVQRLIKHSCDFTNVPIYSIIAFNNETILNVESTSHVLSISEVTQTIIQYHWRWLSSWQTRCVVKAIKHNQKSHTKRNTKRHIRFAKRQQNKNIFTYLFDL